MIAYFLPNDEVLMLSTFEVRSHASTHIFSLKDENERLGEYIGSKDKTFITGAIWADQEFVRPST